WVRSSTDCRMNGAWSSTTVTVALRAAPPSISVMRGSAPRISSDTATVLASAFFVTAMPMLGTPLVRVYPVAGAGAAVIVAMSPSRTGIGLAAPVGGATTARGLTRPPGGMPARGAAFGAGARPVGAAGGRCGALLVGVGVAEGRGETLGDGLGGTVGPGWAPPLGAAVATDD